MWRAVNKSLLFLCLSCFFAQPSLALTDFSLSTNTSGSGATLVNLDDDPRPEYIVGWVDSVNTADQIYYRVAKNVDNAATAVWGNVIDTGYSPGNLTSGMGLSVADINQNGIPDLILVTIDNPDGENNVRYNIGWDLDADGNVTHGWSGRRVEDSIHVGYYTDYAGSGVWDLDRNGLMDVLVVWADDATDGGDNFYYVIMWNLDQYGYPDSISDRMQVRSDWHPSSVQGLGAELVNIDDNPAPELVLSLMDDPTGNNKYAYMFGYNLGTDGWTDNWSTWTNGPANNSELNAGMGLAVGHLDYDWPQELLVSSVQDLTATIGIPSDNLHFDSSIEIDSSKTLGTFASVSTPERVEMLRHLGDVVMVMLDDDRKGFHYSVMADDESWSAPAPLALPQESSDTSVQSTVYQSPIGYAYDTAGIQTAAFHLVSDGQYLYLFRASEEGFIFIDRYVLDRFTGELNRVYDIRFQRSGLKCESDPDSYDSPGFEDMDKNPFYEPSLQLWGLWNANVKVGDFTVVITPTSLPNEQRWQIFALDKYTSDMHLYSVRRAKQDTCDSDSRRVYFEGLLSDANETITYEKDDGTTGTADIPGIVHKTFSAASLGYTGRWFSKGPTATVYANQLTCDNEIVKGSQRIKMIVPTSTATEENSSMVDVDMAVSGLGVVSSLETADIRTAYSDPACGDEAPAYTFTSQLAEVAEDAPYVFESADGFLHLMFKHEEQWSMVYDTLSDKWLTYGSDESSQVTGGEGEWWGHGTSLTTYARNPLFYYETPITINSTAAEYGSYGYDSKGNLVGRMKCAYAFMTSSGLVVYNGDQTGNLDLKYIGQELIDSTLVGYIEGAPPVPKENLTESDDYSGISSVEINTATSVTQQYTQSKDWGFDFSSDGNIGAFAYSVESSYGFLSENTASSESVETIAMSQGITGKWNNNTGRWDPYNTGIALIKAKKADIYALFLEGSDRVFSYQVIPIADSEEEYLTSFVINDHYVKNGTLDGRVGFNNDEDWTELEAGEKGSYYRDDELAALEKKIKNKQARIRAFYKNYDSNAFQSVPDLDSISMRNIINEYDWTATAGKRAKEVSYANSASESLGGSFSFQGMAGVSLGDAIFGSYEINTLAGGHVSVDFNKSEETGEAFGLGVECDVEGRGILDGELNPVTPGKVDYYKWKTVYLSPDEENFYDFFDRVVDPEWLQTNNVYANRLREARNRVNQVWRARHFVTFVSRVYQVQ